MVDAPGSSLRSMVMNLSTKPTGVLEYCNEEETKCLLHFSGRLLLNASLKAMDDSMNISLFTVAIHVRYSRGFWESLEAN
jgi:small nuclear ribonucleoprotein (snRNP)-like protein